MSTSQIGLSGLMAVNTAISGVANNIANTETVGYKSSNAVFGNLVSGDGLGKGTSINGNKTDFSQGGQTSTGRVLDMMVDGNGYFIVSKEGSDQDMYTRNGQFSLSAEGKLVTNQGLNVQGYEQNASGSYSLNPVDISIPANFGTPELTDTVGVDINLKSMGDSFSTSLPVYDSLGNQNNMDMTFTRTAPNQWDVQYDMDGSSYGPFPITFDAAGQIVGAPVQTINTPAFSNGAAAQTIDVDLTAITQYAGSHTLNSIDANGFGIGALEGIEVTPEGVISATYSNGQSIQQFKVAMATFPNDDGLKGVGGGDFVAGVSAGGRKLAGAGENGVGNVVSSALEASNVDLTSELVDLITYQQSYKANSKVISTSSELSETTLNLSR
ncbi:flagellar hook protein FlgE [Pseudoalteromonas marina]|uniref:Flagellar hook protein FlgE n=1 Tax=Pseudoalteromonas marina TaxID=267375 RepID=A0ABT9FC40_9GAMM|nr:flagellar hook protein FlgE [Pseudoalteromonas marina]MDP2564353.1 flagellar hook protein FlgE [Pseudoalteromonas marina]